MRGTTKRRIKSKRSHLADLLSRKDVKEGFDRKPTTIVLSGVTKSDAGSKRSVLTGSEWN